MQNINQFVLAIDRDAHGLRLFTNALGLAGYQLRQTIDPATVRSHLESGDCRAVVIDRFLPEISGLQLAKLLRGSPATHNMPIVMISNRASELDVIEGLESGVDDFMVKPLRAHELVRRLQAIIRRRTFVPETLPVALDNFVYIDDEGSIARAGSKLIQLTTTEFKLLACLVRSSNRLLTRDQLISHVWQDPPDKYTRKVDVHIKRLRSALNVHGLGETIQTSRGEGYFFKQIA
jgi:two-component system, OmpR family, phosphate regulon response regulator PhoB